MKLFTSVLFVLILTNCYAQNPDSTSLKKAPWFVERFKVSVGTFLPVSNTDIQVGIKGIGTDIDFETDLGFNKSQLTFLANLQWRATRRSRVSFNYYNIPRSSTHVIDKDIVFNNQTYPVNASVNAIFNTAIFQISYGYAIMAKPNYELGVMIGSHLVGGNVGMSLNNANGSISGSTDFGFTAPLPDLGIWGGYAFNDRLALNADFSYLSLAVGDYSGSILTYNLLFMYKVMDKLDLSLGYSGLSCTFNVVKTNAEGHFKWSYNGPSLGVTYSFGRKSWTH